MQQSFIFQVILLLCFPLWPPASFPQLQCNVIEAASKGLLYYYFYLLTEIIQSQESPNNLPLFFTARSIADLFVTTAYLIFPHIQHSSCNMNTVQQMSSVRLILKVQQQKTLSLALHSFPDMCSTCQNGPTATGLIYICSPHSFSP